jgi:hypothetical protein
LDYGVDKLMMLEQNYVDMMIQHGLEGICSVDYIMSLELPSAMFAKFFAQQVLIVAHVGVNMNLTKRQMLNNL